MKRLFVLLLVVMPVVAAAAQVAVYRWIDSNGVVHYSDQPHPGAVKVNLGAPSVVTFNTQATTPPPDVTAQKTERRHYQVHILAPSDGTTLRPADWKVQVAVSVQPPLGEGANLQYNLDGKPVGSPTQSTQVTLDKVYRGTHTLTVSVVGANGASAGQASSTFYVHHPSILIRNRERKRPSSSPGG